MYFSIKFVSSYRKSYCAFIQISVYLSVNLKGEHMLQIFDSLEKKKVEFSPIDPNEVKIYVCGPTVYNHPHIGNARPAVFFDMFVRLLRALYPKVIYVRNITDVDDKINLAAKNEGVSIDVITKRFTKIYHDDLSELGCLLPDKEPTATETMQDMIACINKLVGDGHAYVSDSHVLFSVQSVPDYGILSGRKVEENQAGARVEVASYKKDPQDFVLWKPAQDDEPGWDSPWGRGRPGWHIECTAMIEKNLGLPIDIHGGGGDLLFPHHENERAQGVCLHNHTKPYANFWMHNGMIHMGSDKMSKSLGNIILVKDLLENMPGEVLRLVLLQTHYRQPLIWKEDTIAQASNWLDKAYRQLSKIPMQSQKLDWSELPEAFRKALLDDVNTPLALQSWYQLLRDTVGLSGEQQQLFADQVWSCADILGIAQVGPDEWFKQKSSGNLSDIDIEKWIQARAEAKSQKDFVRADAIRDDLAKQGVVLEDKHGKTTWRYV